MLNKKIAIIIPYFGKLPKWFDLFLLSCSKNNSIHFFIFTDDETNFNYSENIIVNYMKFSQAQELFKSKLNNNIYIGHPYKFCDYRPCYGHVFSEYLKDYDFWGHCDIDLIFGDIEKYLSKIELNSYDRLFSYGHFSLYRNTEKVNNAFRLKLGKTYPSYFDFDVVSRSTYPCYFDEVGMNVIFKLNGFKFYENQFSANVNISFKKFRLNSGIYDAETLLVHKGKSVFEYKKKHPLEINEYMYLHLQNRSDIRCENKIKNDFIISEEGFIPFEEEKLNFYFESIGIKESVIEQKEYLKKVNLFYKRKSKRMLFNEIKFKKFKIISSIIDRYMIVRWLRKNKIH